MRQAYFNRALAKFNLDDLPGAQADLTHLLGDPEPPLRAYFLRARVRGSARGSRGRPARPGRRACEGNRATNRTGRRGGSPGSRAIPRAALADYEAALKINPRYLTALQNKANVLAENLGRTQDAIAVLDRILALRADDVARHRQPGRLARPARPTRGRARRRNRGSEEGFEAVQHLPGRRNLLR